MTNAQRGSTEPVPVFERKRTARIDHYPNRRLFRYGVHRLDGIGIPEKSYSHHTSRKRAERAAQRWVNGGLKSVDLGERP